MSACKLTNILNDTIGHLTTLAADASSQPRVAAQISPRKVEWLWPKRIPIGKLSILDGDPGSGKSLICVEIGARLTRGEPMPGSTVALRGGVVLLTAEDDLGDTVVPRLIAAGADLSRILVPKFVPLGRGEAD